MVTMKKPGETSIQSFSLPLTSLVTADDHTELDHEAAEKVCLSQVTIRCVLCMYVCIYIHTVARTNSCKIVVLRGCEKLRGAISYFLATGSWKMSVEAASAVDPKY